MELFVNDSRIMLTVDRVYVHSVHGLASAIDPHRTVRYVAPLPGCLSLSKRDVKAAKLGLAKACQILSVKLKLYLAEAPRYLMHQSSIFFAHDDIALFNADLCPL